MIYCPKCQKELQNNSVFCRFCNIPIAAFLKQQKDETIDLHIQGPLNISNLPHGFIIDDRYEVIKKIGHGGFGAVYHVYDRKMALSKALKILHDSVANDCGAMNRVRNEAQIMIKLNHPNIIRVYDFNQDGQFKYIDMEFILGDNLAKLKNDSPDNKLSEKQALEYAMKIARGLAYAHSKEILHKDIKPQNILVDKDSNVKIMDFGLSEILRDNKSRLDIMPISGSPPYMSPEQFAGKNIGKESDIYSFGAMLYELLSGQLPFYRGDIKSQLENETPQHIQNVSRSTNRFLQKCLVKDYKSRYRSFDQVIKALNHKTSYSALAKWLVLFALTLIVGSLAIKVIPSIIQLSVGLITSLIIILLMFVLYRRTRYVMLTILVISFSLLCINSLIGVNNIRLAENKLISNSNQKISVSLKKSNAFVSIPWNWGLYPEQLMAQLREGMTGLRVVLAAGNKDDIHRFIKKQTCGISRALIVVQPDAILFHSKIEYLEQTIDFFKTQNSATLKEAINKLNKLQYDTKSRGLVCVGVLDKSSDVVYGGMVGLVSRGEYSTKTLQIIACTTIKNEPVMLEFVNSYSPDKTLSIEDVDKLLEEAERTTESTLIANR